MTTWLMKFEVEDWDADEFMDSITSDLPKELLATIPDNWDETIKEKAKNYMFNTDDYVKRMMTGREVNALSVQNAFMDGMRQMLHILNLEGGVDFSQFYCVEADDKGGQRCKSQCSFCKSI